VSNLDTAAFAIPSKGVPVGVLVLQREVLPMCESVYQIRKVMNAVVLGMFLLVLFLPVQAYAPGTEPMGKKRYQDPPAFYGTILCSRGSIRAETSTVAWSLEGTDSRLLNCD